MLVAAVFEGVLGDLGIEAWEWHPHGLHVAILQIRSHPEELVKNGDIL